MDKNSLPEEPSYHKHRVAVFEEWVKKNEKENKELSGKEIKIKLPDNTELSGVAYESTPLSVAGGISPELANQAIVSKVNGELWDVFRPLEEDCSLEILTEKNWDKDDGLKHVFWHSSSHILGLALEYIYHCQLCIGPALEEGFYYDVRMEDENASIKPEDFQKIQSVVNQLIKKKYKYERVSIPREAALEMFKDSVFKKRIIELKVQPGSRCTVYRCGNLVDLCTGPHVPTTGKVKTFLVTKSSSSYWLGSSENETLQRVYGISFPDKQRMKDHKKFLEEAKKRDHRMLGKKHELVYFNELSPGSANFLFHGTRIYNKLVDFMRREFRIRGYNEVITPNIFNVELWKRSGHYANYKENMFSFEVEKQPFALKPMNCPGHCLVFKLRPRSYKELPLRICEFGILHRNELSGALSGLTRVRRFVQDDAHLFVTPDQIGMELKRELEFFDYVIKTVFKMEYTLELSTRPETKYLGEIAQWDHAEKVLQGVLEEMKIDYVLNQGDGAFYGPKIDMHVLDAMKKTHQLATLQLDFNLPERFELEYVPESVEEGKIFRPVMIHRALLGSIERFFALLLENNMGKYPLWVSPKQVMIVPVSPKYFEYCEKIHKEVLQEDFYVDMDDTKNTLQKKIRNAQLAQYNYIFVCGQEEMDSDVLTVNVRTRNNEVLGVKPLSEILDQMKKDIKEYL